MYGANGSYTVAIVDNKYNPRNYWYAASVGSARGARLARHGADEPPWNACAGAWPPRRNGRWRSHYTIANGNVTGTGRDEPRRRGGDGDV